MGEETQTKETGSNIVTPKVDLTLFRRAQQVGERAASPVAFKEAVNENVKLSLGTDGEHATELLEFVEQYQEIIGEPYSVKYFGAEDILNDLTRKDFEKIDEYILGKLRKLNKKTTLESFNKAVSALEDLLGLDKENQTMHRIVKVARFIELGKERKE